MTFKKEEEIIVVVEREKLFEKETLAFQGVTTDKLLIDRLMSNIDDNYKSMRRGSDKEKETPLDQNAELNFDFKQPIPYVVISRGGSLYITERLSGGGEARLHGKLAMGVGGHMNPEPPNAPFPILLGENTNREIEEELEITGEGELRIQTVGIINDDSEDTGRVHIGILGILVIPEDNEVVVRETDQLKGSWMTIAELKEPATYERLENWGKIVVDMM